MKGLMIKCPECGKALKIRTSERPGACLTLARAYCPECDIKAQINVQLEHIQKGTFEPVKQNHQWQQDIAIKQKLTKPH
ncbi:hypothetical protein EV694_1553 [Volucribacter psittacicida]|uniref:Ogr/Delta-like zinc finger protein n=1 Tax=Volucribacter psittacicida TaxID=203482 RepID=A0A4R1FRM4_9PAST|nr:transposase [Volucribacter psittacicida]TCJ97956.1 hypothetical protein EV694_1553 [Volucribacter psittacicida]